MLEYLRLLLGLVCAVVRDREALVAENLLLRQQLAVLTRPTRKRPQLHTRDKLFWVVARARCREWRRHLVLVRPESVICVVSLHQHRLLFTHIVTWMNTSVRSRRPPMVVPARLGPSFALHEVHVAVEDQDLAIQAAHR